ncbi:MAG: NADH-quinone oxidoreductase subunit H [Candidatus Thalassarchaeum sp.]|nr:NADH-quinone oxidoreductase subunit H [Candidatus Thalassarchaeum sp.]|tara:strand:+ start:2448 stop:3896 length:1449 start_codon:yes stop_codon:yes gene_type:complete
MATEDVLDIRGWVHAATDFVAENTVGMSRHWEYTDSVSMFLTEFLMAVLAFSGIMGTLPVLLWMERKLLGRFMDRRGARTSLRSLWIGENGVTAGEWWNQLPFGTGVPVGMLNRALNDVAGNDHELEVVSRVNNRSWHGVWWLLPGFFQNVADGMKFLTKEHMVPEKADRYVFEVAPFLIIATTVMCFTFIPLGPHYYSNNAEMSILFLMAVFSVAPLGVFFAGWSSNNKYTLLGGIRSAAQLTAYEIPLLITVLGVVVISGSFNLIEVIEFQADSGVWNVFLMPLGAVLFIVVMVAEVERIPFDMPEAEAELVEGWWTEYGGMRWGLMFAAEYLRTYAACLLFAHFFLGGWEAPFEDTIPYISYVPHIVWVLLKSWFMFIFFVWFRAALHRVRTDQILEFGWRWLLPLSLVNLAIAAALRLWVYDGINEEWPILIPVLITSISLALFILLSIDEDPEALEAQTRPFSVQTVDVAGPGQHRE